MTIEQKRDWIIENVGPTTWDLFFYSQWDDLFIAITFTSDGFWDARYLDERHVVQDSGNFNSLSYSIEDQDEDFIDSFYSLLTLDDE